MGQKQKYYLSATVAWVKPVSVELILVRNYQKP